MKENDSPNLNIDAHLSNKQDSIESILVEILSEQFIFLKQGIDKRLKVGSHHLLIIRNKETNF